MCTNADLNKDFETGPKLTVKQPKSPVSKRQGCPTVALSHQSATRASKSATNQKLKALFNWEVFVKHDQLSLLDVLFELFLEQIVFEKRWTPFSIGLGLNYCNKG